MPPDPRAYLWDMQDAALAIQAFISGLGADDYITSTLVQAAVERKFEVIGEALNQLGRLDDALAARVPQRRQIVAFRNLLVHGYAAVDNRTVWNAIDRSLPPLLASVRTLLKELGDA